MSKSATPPSWSCGSSASLGSGSAIVSCSGGSVSNSGASSAGAGSPKVVTGLILISVGLSLSEVSTFNSSSSPSVPSGCAISTWTSGGAESKSSIVGIGSCSNTDGFSGVARASSPILSLQSPLSS